MKKISVLIIMSLIILPSLALADNTPTGEFTVHPTYKHGENTAWIVDSVTPGDSYTDFITLENLTNTQQEISLKMHEAEQKENFEIKENTDYENIGNWIRLPRENYLLSPNEKIKIPVQISIPSHAKFGEYTGTILASQSKTNSQNIKIVTRIGVRIYLTVGNQNLHASVLNLNNQFSPAFFILSLLGLAGAITLNIMSFRQKNAK